MASAHDIKASEKTYAGFISLLKWTVPLIAVATTVIVILISN